MQITNETILQADYEVADVCRGHYDGAIDQENHQKTPRTIIPEYFKDDVQALCKYAGLRELVRGMSIRMSLQEILGIIPKTRKRVDSYKALIQFLNDELGVTLIINSQKTKNYGKKAL